MPQGENYRNLLRAGLCPRCRKTPEDRTKVYCRQCVEEIGLYKTRQRDREKVRKYAKTILEISKKLPAEEIRELLREAAVGSQTALRIVKAKDRT